MHKHTHTHTHTHNQLMTNIGEIMSETQTAKERMMEGRCVLLIQVCMYVCMYVCM